MIEVYILKCLQCKNSINKILNEAEGRKWLMAKQIRYIKRRLGNWGKTDGVIYKFNGVVDHHIHTLILYLN